MKRVEDCLIISNEPIMDGIFRLVVKSESICKTAKPGQFVNLYLRNKAFLLPRPISICDVADDNITLVYQTVGVGTNEISEYKSGDCIKVLGALGNGFSIDKNRSSYILVGGGIGTPPLLYLCKSLEGKKDVYLGFRNSPILVEELSKYADVHIATDDGGCGYKGTIVDYMREKNKTAEYFFACGPKPMLKALSEYAYEKNMQGEISVEERMGCGYGVCVGCTVKIKRPGEEDYSNLKVCVDGPVFDYREVVWNG